VLFAGTTVAFNVSTKVNFTNFQINIQYPKNLYLVPQFKQLITFGNLII